MYAGGIGIQHILIRQCGCFTASGAVCPAGVHPQGYSAASRAVSGELPSFVTAVVASHNPQDGPMPMHRKPAGCVVYTVPADGTLVTFVVLFSTIQQRTSNWMQPFCTGVRKYSMLRLCQRDQSRAALHCSLPHLACRHG